MLLLVRVAGLVLFVQTGEYGAKMVFAYGFGVQSAPPDDHAPHDHPMQNSKITRPRTAEPPRVAEDDSRQSSPSSGAGIVLEEDFRFEKGCIDDHTVTPEDSLVASSLQGGAMPFVTGDEFRSIQTGALFNVDAFDGSVGPVHHVHGPQDYDFLALEEGMIQECRARSGAVETFDETEHAETGWLALRAVSDSRHFRGYPAEAMRVDGHGEPPESGPVGFRIEGTGTGFLRRIYVQALR